MAKYVSRLEGILHSPSGRSLCLLTLVQISARNRIDKNNNIADLNVSVKEISDVIQILHANKTSEPDVISHKMLKLCPSDN
jgi:hypothetical protein